MGWRFLDKLSQTFRSEWLKLLLKHNQAFSPAEIRRGVAFSGLFSP